MRYSRKQIQEAIRYWENQLKLMNEKIINESSKSNFIHELINIFGESKIYSDFNSTYSVNMSECELIRDLASKFIFTNQLKTRQIEFLNEIPSPQGDALGRYLYNFKPHFDRQKYVDGLILIDEPTNMPKIQLNIKKLSQPINIIFVVNLIVHEMIHQFTVECGNYLTEKFLSMINKKKFNAHTHEFIKMMNDINDNHGLNINIVGTSIDAECQLSLEKIRKFDGFISSMNETDFINTISDYNDQFSEFYENPDGSYTGMLY